MKRIDHIRKTGLLLCCVFYLIQCAVAKKEDKYAGIFLQNGPVLFDYCSSPVFYSFAVSICPDKVKSREKWILTPVITLKENGGTVRRELEPVAIEGNLYRNLRLREQATHGKDANMENERVFLAQKDTIYTIPYTGTVEIKEGTTIEKVSFSIMVHSCCDYKPKPEYVLDFANLNTFADFSFLPATLEANGLTSDKLKTRKVEGKAYLHFDINKTEINLSYPENGEQVANMISAFRKILLDPYARFDSAYIRGQASPEGPYNLNRKLAIGRARSALFFLEKELAGMNIGYDESQFTISTIPEAWDELCQKIASSKLDEEEKKIVLDIIRNTPDRVAREQKLRRRHKTFEYIKNEILGKIRRVDYAFYLTFKDLTLEEQFSLLHTRPDIYSPSDFLAVVNHTDSPEEKIETLQIAASYYPDDRDISGTLLGAYLDTNDMENAGLLADSFSGTEVINSRAFMRNQGVFYLKTGQYDMLERVLENLSQHMDLLPEEVKAETDYLYGLLYLGRKEYQNASDLLAGVGDVNMAVALAGLGEYEDAWDIMQSVECSEADELYFKAILAANNSYMQEALELLEKALEAKPSLSNRIMKEYAFRTLWSNSKWKELKEIYNN